MKADMIGAGNRANPEYGRGTFWRRIKVANKAGRTEAALEDNSHAMRCRLTHSKGRITAVEAEMQVISDPPQRQERNTCDQRHEKSVAVGGPHGRRLAETTARTLSGLNEVHSSH